MCANIMIKLGKTGWADEVVSLDVVYDGGNGCWLYASLDKENRHRHLLLQAQARHAKGCAKTFSPFQGQRGLLFSGGHRPEKYGMKPAVSYGGIFFVVESNPEKHHNPERDKPLIKLN